MWTVNSFIPWTLKTPGHKRRAVVRLNNHLGFRFKLPSVTTNNNNNSTRNQLSNDDHKEEFSIIVHVTKYNELMSIISIHITISVISKQFRLVNTIINIFIQCLKTRSRVWLKRYKKLEITVKL